MQWVLPQDSLLFLFKVSMTAPSQVTGGAVVDVNGTFQTTGAHAAAVMGKQAQAGMLNPMRPGGMDPAGGTFECSYPISVIGTITSYLCRSFRDR